MASNVIDLDILRPASKIIKLNGKTFDVSFIPVAITFDVDEIVRKLSEIDQKELDDGNSDATKEAFDLTVKLCVLFVAHFYPEMDEDWFKEHTDSSQIKVFADTIKDALLASYNGIENYGKN